jgi:hypothetical protein
VANLELEDDSAGYERPLLIRIIGVLSIVAGLLLIIAGILSAGIFTTLVEETEMISTFPLASLQALFYLIIGSGIAITIQGWGLLKMKAWGWMMAAFFLLSAIFFSVHGYATNTGRTSTDLSFMAASILIAGLLLAYFVKRKDYFDVSALSTRAIIGIVGGLVAYSVISFLVMEMVGTSLMESLPDMVFEEGLYSL